MDEHKLPSNIRQIGSISGGLKIYIEDFVFTYLNQYAEAGDYCEKIALLVGHKIVVDGEDVLFVCGAVQGKHLTNDEGLDLFSDKSFFYAEEQIAKYFKGLEIVGWMQSQPGYSVRLNPFYEKYHENNFRNNYNVLFVLDPIERINTFYRWNDAGSGLEECGGYFIYYDKNNGMQEYMLQNRLSKYKISDEYYEPITKTAKKAAPMTYTAKNPSIARSAAVRGEYAPKSDRRLTNMLVTLSAVLFVICFIMGAGLIQNENRITTLEGDLDSLLQSYTNIQTQLRQVSTQSVFAGQQSPLPSENTATPTPAPSYPPVSVVSEMPTEAPSAQPQQTVAPAEVTNPPTPEPTAEPTEEPDETPDGEEVPDGDDLFHVYVVQPGDNLSYISEMFYGTNAYVNDIMRANDMTNPDKIVIGNELKIPKITGN